MSTFIELIKDEEYGDYYVLTKTGYTALIVAIVLFIAVAALIIGKRQKANKLGAKSLAFAGIALALAFVTSYIKYEMPMGGSVTLFSMFFIAFIGYVYGINVGLITAFAYSLLQFIQTGATYFLTPFQTCCDYFLAFTALGVAGFWYKKKHGLVIGYVVACIVRGIFHTIGGYMYWMDYMPDSFPKSLASIYPIVYNYFFILTEMIITLIVINLPPVKKAINKVVDMAQNK